MTPEFAIKALLILIAALWLAIEPDDGRPPRKYP